MKIKKKIDSIFNIKRCLRCKRRVDGSIAVTYIPEFSSDPNTVYFCETHLHQSFQEMVKTNRNIRMQGKNFIYAQKNKDSK